jgi:hypothetical protein
MKQIMGIFILALALGLSPPAAGILHAQDREPNVVSGTLVKLDLDSLRGLLTTDLGKPVFFEVPKAYLFENVTLGARITLQLDEQGRAIKVMDTSLPDLITPTVMPKGQAVAQPLAAGLVEDRIPETGEQAR